MRTVPRILAVVLPVVAALSLAGGAAQAAGPTKAHDAAANQAGHGGTCQTVSVKAPAGATVESIEATLNPGGLVSFPVQPGATEPPAPVSDVPAFCDVVVTLTHGHAGDHERIEVWLPQSGWAGRFQALGGSGYSAGDFGPNLATAVKAGYAVGSQDAGATPVTGWTSPWALQADGTVNQTILENFASRGAHELALVGKGLVKSYYGHGAAYSYWNGCSTGGRQGYVEAQQHPGDFDGILAAAPALSWDRFAVADLWPNVVLNNEHSDLTPCELNAFTQAAIAACDPLDGHTDGIIDDPLDCTFDPATLVGTVVVCDGQPATITAEDARIVEKIWDGPTTTSGKQLWYGLPRGADLTWLTSQPFPVAEAWVQDFVVKDPSFDVTGITYAQFQQLFEQSVREYHGAIGSDDTDLSAFRKAGGKLLSWQGLADQLVPVSGTLQYQAAVADRFPGTVDSFYRLFLAPGASHCAPGDGPAPTDALTALVHWVEDGSAPATLPASLTRADGTTVDRQLHYVRS
ncbi:MAG: tannase/feruloyl esterase family alpha/beta hydrolase [Promicromonosporaceae bacterium]|nr:tannase/feruloyl esterase family alpha/beta hydrolase [Promicromonosporaceae bacterium]